MILNASATLVRTSINYQLLLLKMSFKIFAGAHSAGLTVIRNGASVSVGARGSLSMVNSSFHHVSKSVVNVLIDDFEFGIVNSDSFLNIAARLTNSAMLQAGAKAITVTSNGADAAKQLSLKYPEYQVHGLLGQTWRNIEWPHKKWFEGEPTDYQVSSLSSPDFVYTQYLH